MNPEIKAILDALLESRQFIEAKLGAIENRLDSMDSRLGSVENRLESVENRLESVENRLDTLTTDMAEVKEQVFGLTARDKYFATKIAAIEADLFVVKERQKRD